MRLIDHEKCKFFLVFNFNEVIAINNSLNEVCNGPFVFDLMEEKKHRKISERLLEKFGEIYKEMENSRNTASDQISLIKKQENSAAINIEQQEVKVMEVNGEHAGAELNKDEVSTLKEVLSEICSSIDSLEFQTVIGVDKSYVLNLIGNFEEGLNSYPTVCHN